MGACWVFIRDNGSWAQQGAKLVGSGAVGISRQGYSVSLSADGNTFIVGGNRDNNFRGAAWIFTRTNSVWSQQGDKLVGSGHGVPQLGNSVAISADGNTVLVGGPQDNSGQGGIWVFVRSNSEWNQQGAKLLGSGAAGLSRQGFAVALSADGNAALAGAPFDNSLLGAAWVFTRANNVWTQQGPKLTGTATVGAPLIGSAVSLSPDGNTAVLGGQNDDTLGAVWVFKRTNNTWSQNGNKLVGRVQTVILSWDTPSH